MTIRTLLSLSFLLVFPSFGSQLRAEPWDFVGAYLTWNDDPATSITVNWVNLYEDTPTQVIYRHVGEEEWKLGTGRQSQLAPSVLQVRRVKLEGLQPDSEYEFFPAAEIPTWMKPLRFRTMPAELSRPIRFVTGGDMMHSRQMADAMNKMAGQLDPDFALLGGDLAYANGVEATRWIDWIQSWYRNARTSDDRLIPLIAVIGNHEVRRGGRKPEDAPYYYGLFELPEGKSFYALDFRDYLSIIALDSEHTTPVIGPQTDWLEQALDARKDQRFVFPIYHFPAYGTAKASEGQLPSDSPRAVRIQQNWLPVFEKYGVTAVFENDHHNYKRTHPIRKNQRDDENGIVFLGDGAWGVRTRGVPAPGEAWYLAHAEATRHLFQVTLFPDGRSLYEAFTAEGGLFDTVVLDRPRTIPEE